MLVLVHRLSRLKYIKYIGYPIIFNGCRSFLCKPNEKRDFFREWGQNIENSVLVLTNIVSDRRNRMALSDFENSQNLTIYGKF